LIDLCHASEMLRLELSGTSGDDDAGVGTIAPHPADGLACLTNGFGRNCTGIDDYSMLKACCTRMGGHHLGFVGIKTTAKRDDSWFGQGEEGADDLEFP
jgi:hypothetical protein